MNLMAELDRLTSPAPCASKIRSLSAAEISELQAAGKITPIKDIPFLHTKKRVSFLPEPKGGNLYGKSIAACKRFYL